VTGPAFTFALPMKIYLQGRGTVSAAGNDVASSWASYVSGRKTWQIDEETGLPVYGVTGLPTTGPIADFVERTKADRTTWLALTAAEQAVAQAGWQDKDFAILVGCSRGPTESWEKGYDHFLKTGAAKTKTSPQTTLGSIGFALAEYFSTSTLASSLSVTCSSGMHAVLHGVALLKAGMVDRVLVGGAESSLTPFTLRMMQSLRICASVPEENLPACRPLENPASGMAIGEGAAFLALSREPAELELKALAFARESAGSSTGITPDGAALRRTMGEAIQRAGYPDVIIAHAPGTKRGDAAESRAVQDVYAATPEHPVVRSFKWATGHTFGASGPLALDAACTVLEQGLLPEMPYGGVRDAPLNLGTVLVNATGFGGNAVSLVVGRRT
jgi:3-oxoacyl-[acyl-carrier-protein] synthase II